MSSLQNVDLATSRRIITQLRRIWFYSKTRSAMIKQAQTGKDSFKCAKCKKSYCRKSVCVDHIFPVVEIDKGFVTWDIYIERLLGCSTSELQVLCKPCHKKKTKDEQEQRRKIQK